ncbi:MAG TPA: hypothetical protein VF902_00415 [Coriobacteriia bacterium]
MTAAGAALAAALAMAAPTAAFAADRLAGVRFPEQLRDPGMPLFYACVACGIALGVLIGVPLAVIQLRIARKRRAAAPASGEPPAPL